MDRGPTGHFEPIASGSRTLDAFVPDPLPPDPPLDYEHVRPAVEEASRSIMRLYAPHGLSLPRVAFFHSLGHREAIFSTRLAGVRVSTSDSFRMDPHRLLDTPRSVIMATQLRIAGDEGWNRVEGGAPVSVALVRELHATMFSVFADIGAFASGEFRTGSRWPLDASAPPAYVPPPARHVSRCMADLEAFLAGGEGSKSPVIRSGLAYAQFASIRPFPDGNMRMARLVAILALCAGKESRLDIPFIQLSEYLLEHDARCRELIDGVRRRGDWEAWMAFWLEALRESADRTFALMAAICRVHDADRARIVAADGPHLKAALSLHRELTRHVVTWAFDETDDGALPAERASPAADLLIELGIAADCLAPYASCPADRRVYCYPALLGILGEDE